MEADCHWSGGMTGRWRGGTARSRLDGGGRSLPHGRRGRLLWRFARVAGDWPQMGRRSGFPRVPQHTGPPKPRRPPPFRRSQESHVEW